MILLEIMTSWHGPLLKAAVYVIENVIFNNFTKTSHYIKGIGTQSSSEKCHSSANFVVCHLKSRRLLAEKLVGAWILLSLEDNLATMITKSAAELFRMHVHWYDHKSMFTEG